MKASHVVGFLAFGAITVGSFSMLEKPNCNDGSDPTNLNPNATSCSSGSSSSSRSSSSSSPSHFSSSGSSSSSSSSGSSSGSSSAAAHGVAFGGFGAAGLAHASAGG